MNLIEARAIAAAKRWPLIEHPPAPDRTEPSYTLEISGQAFRRVPFERLAKIVAHYA